MTLHHWLVHLPFALLLGGARVAMLMRGSQQGSMVSTVLTLVERGEILYLAVSLVAGLAIMIRALGRVRSVTARRQLRWIVWGTAFGAAPFVLGYGLPYALGRAPFPGAELSAILLGLVPLAFASAIVRYRLMDVEVIIKRGLVYAAAITAIIAIYAVLLNVAQAVTKKEQPNELIAFLMTAVIVLLSRPVKNAIQNGLDRVYYRDRYDYRRALVGFARDLNSDLDLLRLSERLVHRVARLPSVEHTVVRAADGADVVARRRRQRRRAHAAGDAAHVEPERLHLVEPCLEDTRHHLHAAGQARRRRRQQREGR